MRTVGMQGAVALDRPKRVRDCSRGVRMPHNSMMKFVCLSGIPLYGMAEYRSSCTEAEREYGVR